MFFKETWVSITDGTNIQWIKIFHLYKGFYRKFSNISFFIKGTSKVVDSPRIEYKGFKYKFSIKGDINRVLLIRSYKNNFFFDNSYISITYNSGIILKKKYNLRSKFLYGPISYNIYRKKITSLYQNIL